MFLPAETEKLYDAFANIVYKADALDKKNKELIAVACSVMADCVPCIKHHYGAAQAAGANTQELAETMAIAMGIAAGSKRAKYKGLITELSASETG
ncbi:MAG: carboxymuconolactone decarboxylase family protein [Hyphomicrobiales bacterium]|nr:carboxymuconolactone decarboxylase family protein [Hyphomicrobiales bacterium]MCP5076428.1 carboxymuconolactone decarboxylase family protein [Paracoccaceae bacterium]